jgi:outer membrane protein assembly factor BamB
MSTQFWTIVGCLALMALVVTACRSNLAATATDKPAAEAAITLPTPAPTLTIGPSPTPASLRAPLWTFATQGEVWSSPTVKDGVVYFGSDDHFLYAVDVATHQLKWKFETGDLVRSRPAVAAGTVYFTSDDNYLYAVDAQTGKETWRFDMGKAVMPREPIPRGWDYMQSSPAVADGVVYVGSANPNFYAVDAKTGQEKWRFKAGLYVRSSPAVVNGVVYFGDWLGKLFALDAQTGQEKWNFNTGDSVVPSPTVVDGVVYVGSKYPCLFALDAQNGQKKWCFSYPSSIAWVESSAAVADGVVYVGSSDWMRLNAVDAATGKLRWYFNTKGDPWCSPAVAEGVVYIGATGGYFYALDAAAGRELWRVRTDSALKTMDVRFDGGVVSSPAVVDGIVYFGSMDGKLYAVGTAL